MHPDVQKLLQVQKVDQSLAKIRRDLDSVPKERARREVALERLRAEHEAVVQGLRRSEVDAHSNEVSIKQSDEEIQRLEARLNFVRNNAEYQATLLQIESVKRERGKLEEEGLVLLEAIESFQGEFATSKQRLDADEAVFAEFVEKGEKLLAERGADLERAGAGRGDLVAEVPAELMSRYERIFAARDGLAVCALEGETCTGCYTSIPPNLQVKLQAGSAVVQCNSCQRILYAPE